jgi:TolA-binding protein
MGSKDPSIGYSVAYPFGVIGPILCFYFMTRRVKPTFLAKAQRFHMAEIAVDAAAAGRVVELLLARQPGAATAGDSSLQVAQALSKSGNASGARAVLRRFLRGYPNSPLVADAELSLISLDLRAEDWTNAMTSLDRWISVHTNHSSLVRAEFDRAWAAARSGASTNAVAQFAALAARYPTNAIAETASLWLAGHYFSAGDCARAEAA